MRSIVFLLSLSLNALCFNACDWSAEPGPDGPSRTLDTLSRAVTPGVTLRVESLKDRYAQAEQITARLVVFNHSDTVPFPIFTGNYPPYRWLFWSLDSNAIVAYPPVVFYSEYRDTLRIGDTTSFEFTWSQRYVSTDPALDGTQVPAGNYRLDVRMEGNSLFLPLYKHFDIW